MHRFYIPAPDLRGDTLALTEPTQVHQLFRVLRMKPGDSFSVFDEEGREYSVRILEISARHVLGQVLEKLERHTELSVEVSLYQAIPKKTELFELIVQKATELGVAHIYPLITERTEKRRLSKFERLTRIATEATEQSNRLRVPVIHHPIALEAALEQVSNGYLAYEFEEQVGLLDYGKSLTQGNALQIFIGPEGGFSQKEVMLAKKTGLKTFTLGPRILRTETAATASLALLLHLCR